MLEVGDADEDEDEHEFEWVTDSDEEGPEFECDSCGRVIEETADRFHCETCGDYDLVRPLTREKTVVWGSGGNVDTLSFQIFLYARFKPELLTSALETAGELIECAEAQHHSHDTTFTV